MKKGEATPNQVSGDQDVIDLHALVRNIWRGRGLVIWVTLVFALVGAALVMISPKEYEAHTTMVPQIQLNNSSLSRFGGLAAMAGLNLGSMNNTTADLSPMVYPRVIRSKSFQKELINKPMYFQSLEKEISIRDYVGEYMKPTAMERIAQYTVQLPFRLVRWIRGRVGEDHQEKSGQWVEDEGWLILSADERKAMTYLRKNLSLETDIQEGIITLSVSAQDPYFAADLAYETRILLQDVLTRYKIEKAEENLSFIQARFDDKQAEFIRAQKELAAYRDRNLNRVTASAQTEEEVLVSAYQIAQNTLTGLATQLEDAKIKVTENKPVFSVIEPVTYPQHPASPKPVMLVGVLMIVGMSLALGWLLVRHYIRRFRSKWMAYEQ